MDPEKEKKRQTWRLLITEALMVLTAISMVIILVMVVSGYWINENFEMERSGMLQISSIPARASVVIDGEGLSQHTNVSRVIPTGEHTVKIWKDGYDEWTKSVKVKEGLLYRLHYPRLFLQEREVEKTPLAFAATKISVSPKNEWMLVANTTAKWALINLDEGEIKQKELNLAGLFPNGVGDILSIEWNYDQNRALIGMRFEPEKTEWVVIDLADIKRSVNLSSEFGVGFTRVNFASNSGDSLMAVRNQNLQQINLNNKSISAILAENVGKYYRYGDDVVFTAKSGETAYVGVLRVGRNDVSRITEIDDVENDVFMSRFYDNEYLTIVSGNQIKVFLKNDLEKAVLKFELSFVPETAKMGLLGEFLLVSNGNKLATLDMEAEDLREWEIENSNFGWFDDYMVYVVENGELIVYDFDGFNRRVIAQNVWDVFPATVINDKWMYYISDNNLVREWLVRK